MQNNNQTDDYSCFISKLTLFSAIRSIQNKVKYFFYKHSKLIQEIGFSYIIIKTKQVEQEMDKDYICGCGKAYGSYPAFSTHRKAKHNNVTVPGTQLPSQEKAKRGRPSCDFKKIPQAAQSKKQFYQGLNIIQCGLLDLEQIYKGKILGEPHENNQLNLDDIDSNDDQQKIRITAISTFTRLTTTHMQSQSSTQIQNFFRSLISFGMQTSQLTSIQLYNNYCLNNMKQLINSRLGLNFYVELCLLLSKWMCVVGYSKEILRAKAKQNYNQQGNYRVDVDGVHG